ncbi:MAG TPA: hypothetical protein VHE79_05220 [Spirochaetia bacterium]
MALCAPCSRTLASYSYLLESIESPAALVARDLTVVYANRLLCDATGTTADVAAGLKVGRMLECRHAHGGQECAETEACQYCWLRRAVDLARISGERLPDVPVDLSRISGAHESLSIAAEKAGQAVALLIKHFGRVTSISNA